VPIDDDVVGGGDDAAKKKNGQTHTHTHTHTSFAQSTQHCNKSRMTKSNQIPGIGTRVGSMSVFSTDILQCDTMDNERQNKTKTHKRSITLINMLQPTTPKPEATHRAKYECQIRSKHSPQHSSQT
jgi:hypothetical protein